MARLSQSELLSGLVKIVGAPHVSTSRQDRITYATDFWPKAQLWKMAGDIERFPPDCVVWPASSAEAAEVLRFCNEHHIPLVARGGGSGVCGGAIPTRGGVVVDLKRMRAVRALDPISQTVVVEAGMNGQHLEDYVNAAGFTVGHFPSSIMCSTVGGWIAARSAGQFSSKYGKIEDMVIGLEVALADGAILDTNDRDPGAPDWTQIMIGSEGTLGLVLSAELKLHPLPAARRLRGFRFRHVKDGLRAMRAVMQAGLKPIVLRLYDPFDSMIALGKEQEDPGAKSEGPLGAIRSMFSTLTAGPEARVKRAFAPVAKAGKRAGLRAALSVPSLTNRVAHAVPSACLLIIGFEGPEEATQADAFTGHEILTDHGGVDAGARLGEAWLQKRYAVGFKQTKIFELGAFVDTMEVATTWDRLDGLYAGVVEALGQHAFIMAHFSHAYRDGCSIYFTFAGYKKDPRRVEQHYERCWQVAMDAVLAAGGTISHHHGVGLSKMSAMAREHGGMLKAWRALKVTFDPHGIMNPGKLFPDEAAEDHASEESDREARATRSARAGDGGGA